MASSKVKKVKTVHQKKRVFRASEPILSVLMWGINHTVDELMHINIQPFLMPDDFRAFAKTRVENHLYNKENLPGRFKFKEYCPLVFRDLREKFRIDDTDYMHSLTQSQPVAFSSSGHSGAKFYVSHDKRFIIKLISSEEVALMHQILQQYHEHVVETNGGTLLPHYVGLYRLTVSGDEYYVLTMRNVLPSRLQIHKKFDLKGSTVDRSASEKEKAKDLPTFKDNDFISDALKIHIGEDAKRQLMEKLEKDTAFLTRLKLMDYSLLLGIHDCTQAQMDDFDDDENDDETEEEGASGDDGIGADANAGAVTGTGKAITLPSEQTTAEVAAAVSGLPRPHIALNGKAAAAAIEQGMCPVVDLSVDVFAVMSNDESEPLIYFCGLIDMLTQYGARKRAAHAAKTMKHGTNAEISTVRPEQYAKRFLDFVSRIVE
ncbi:phosphatidylinositol 5-phosphate 4-kinase type-2 alpha-like [Corticium candelabrum]|uniref:phosphatidylinositol 5-phosphate 4-kinase type-2 alpha-like n=1 Tax=Corticium candelabrum TaxID=121492 RepID=UPI002E2622C8|nr:phosphatidylinositol 5-phosphate 4-kinase type-2 alpha-like [Corticium candelabrum]